VVLRHRLRSSCFLVCSGGGHLSQLAELCDEWPADRQHWITFDSAQARALLDGRQVTFAHGPTNRSLTSLARNLVLAWRLVRRHRPQTIVTTGAGIAVPFCYVGRLLGSRVVYVECLSRVCEPSLTGRLVGRRQGARRAARPYPAGRGRPRGDLASLASPEEMASLMCCADVVVTHAGVASMVDAVGAGHRPIVVPRRHHLGEHVDDHQLQIVSALELLGIVTPHRDGVEAAHGRRGYARLISASGGARDARHGARQDRYAAPN
jgi:beta-1,4-N-acetylglucosaminyltransferase